MVCRIKWTRQDLICILEVQELDGRWQKRETSTPKALHEQNNMVKLVVTD